MNSLQLFFLISPLVFGVVAFFRGRIYRKNTINKKRAIKIQVISSFWAAYMFSILICYEQMKNEDFKIIYQGFLFNIFLSVSFLFIIKLFKDEELF